MSVASRVGRGVSSRGGRYTDAVVPGRHVAEVAWFHPELSPGHEALHDHIAFYPGRVDAAWLDGSASRPRTATSTVAGSRPIWSGRSRARRARSAGESRPERTLLMTEEFEQILYAVDEGVLTITLNRPERLNAWTETMGRELMAGFDRADSDDAVRAVIVTGAGRGFCAGADLATGGETFDYRERGAARSTPTTRCRATAGGASCCGCSSAPSR